MPSHPAPDPSTLEWQRIRELAERALDLSPDQQDELLASECAGLPQIEQGVRSILARDRQPNSLPIPALPLAPRNDDRARAAAPPTIGPYTLRRLLGQGGMGNVWLGVQSDGDFHRQVAVKLLHEHSAGDEILARFQRERQVLANLDHPGIARLIDGGISADGQPYIVMEYVEGLRIDRWCDEQGLSVRDRLALFRQVCEAVVHAHQRLVVHRDLKPSNILVTAAGQPKLLDFGIAKVLDPEKQALRTEATRGVMRFFTPAYASPEQVKGLPVTTASDVYSLGVLLFELLSGQLPHRGETPSTADSEPEKPSQAVHRATRAKIRSAKNEGHENTTTASSQIGRRRSTTSRQLARTLAGDLDRIVMQALRSEPLRRYPTVHEFALDVGRFLTGQPVSARPDSAFYRSSRFVRRNKLAVALAGLLLLSLTAGLAGMIWQYRATGAARDEERAQRELAQERLEELQRTSRELESRNQELGAKSEELLRAADESRALATGLENANQLAETRLADLRRYSTTLMFDVYEKIFALQGATEASGTVLETGLDLLDRLAAQGTDDPRLQRDLALAYLRLANHQAGLYRSNLGDAEQAIVSIDKAAELARAAAEAEESAELEAINPSLAARIAIERGDLCRQLARSAEAVNSYRSAIESLTAVEHDDAAPARDRYVLATALSRLGDCQREAGHFSEAEEHVDRTQWLLGALLEANPGSVDYVTDLSVCYGSLGELRVAQGELEEGLELFEESLELVDGLLPEHPRNYQIRRQVANANLQLGITHFMLDQVGEARPRFAVARKLGTEGLAADPTSERAQRDFVVFHFQSATAEARSKNWQAVIDQCEAALPIAEARAGREGAAWLAPLELAQLSVELARGKLQMGLELEAGTDVARAQSLLESFWKPAESEITLSRYYAQAATELGLLLLDPLNVGGQDLAQERRAESARPWLARAEQLLLSFAESGRSFPIDVRDLNRVREGLRRCGPANE